MDSYLRTLRNKQWHADWGRRAKSKHNRSGASAMFSLLVISQPEHSAALNRSELRGAELPRPREAWPGIGRGLRKLGGGEILCFPPVFLHFSCWRHQVTPWLQGSLQKPGVWEGPSSPLGGRACAFLPSLKGKGSVTDVGRARWEGQRERGPQEPERTGGRWEGRGGKVTPWSPSQAPRLIPDLLTVFTVPTCGANPP